MKYFLEKVDVHCVSKRTVSNFAISIHHVSFSNVCISQNDSASRFFLVVKEFRKSVKIWEDYYQISTLRCFETLYIQGGSKKVSCCTVIDISKARQ